MYINDERKDKLLEICKECFKDFAICEWGDDCYMRDEFINLCNPGDEINRQTIHWFEMCIVHLPERMFKRFVIFYGKSHIAHHQAIMLSGAIDPKTKEPMHPVDYMWSMYKSGCKQPSLW